MNRPWRLGPWAASACLLLALAGCANPPEPSPAAPVVFVCEHGSVKSLMAMALFERAAARRGLALRAVSRGVSPDDEVPAPIASAMQADGFDVRGYRPQALSPRDVAGAARIIAIGVDLPAAAGRTNLESWNDVPAASVDYAAARAALEHHIEQLLRELGPRSRPD